MQRKIFWGCLVGAVALGLAIFWVDSRPTWDDTGITAGLVLIVTGLSGFAMPERAWLWALTVGGWIPLLGIARNGNWAALLALAIAFVGAYSGALARKVLSAVLRLGPNQSPPR